MKMKIWLPALFLLISGTVVPAAGLSVDAVCAGKSYPHDSTASTQGLVYHAGYLLESTGRYGGHSSVRRVELETGRILQKRPLPLDYFGEGLALHDQVLYQLTWHNGIVLKYDPDTLENLGSLRVPGEAWGLASDGQRLVLSDGSAVLRFVNPADFAETGRIVVRDEQGEVEGLNELEFAEGLLFANINLSNRAVIIDPDTGRVVGQLDLSRLAETSTPGPRRCLPNGIAYVPDSRCLLVTGKNCSRVLQIDIPNP